MDFSLEDSSSLSKGGMAGIRCIKAQDLGESLGSRPEQGASGCVGILWEGVDQLANAVVEIALQASREA